MCAGTVVRLFIFMCCLLRVFYNGFSIHRNERNNSEWKVLIDHDGGADDAMAIFLAILHEQLFDGPEIVALTTTHGNVDEPQAFNNTQRILGIAQRQDIPIYRGSDKSLIINYPSDGYFGEDGLGDNTYGASYVNMPSEEEHAAIGLIELSKIYEGKLIVLSLGSLSNIALAMRLDPLFTSRLAHLYVAAGHIQSTTHPDPEFNALIDVEAYFATVANENPDKLTLIPFSQTPAISMKQKLHQASERKDKSRAVSERKGDGVVDEEDSTNKSTALEFDDDDSLLTTWRIDTLGQVETTLMEAMNEFESVSLTKGSEWSRLDPMAMAIVLDKALVTELNYSQNSIGLCGADRGICTNEFVTKDEANAAIVYSISEDDYKNFLLQSFSQQYP